MWEGGEHSQSSPLASQDALPQGVGLAVEGVALFGVLGATLLTTGVAYRVTVPLETAR